MRPSADEIDTSLTLRIMRDFSFIRQNFGLRKALLHGLCRSLQRVCLLDVTYLMIKDAQRVVAPERPLECDLHCRFLRAEEVHHFSRDPRNDLQPELVDRLHQGFDDCFAGTVDGRLVSYCWLARHSIEAEFNRCNASPYSGVAFAFPEDCAFRYKGFTHPDFRGHRFYQHVGNAASLAMQQRGVRYLISTTEVVNYAALQNCHRSGYEFFGVIWLLGWGRRVLIISPDLSSRGITIGKRADVVNRRQIPCLPAAHSPPSNLRADRLVESAVADRT